MYINKLFVNTTIATFFLLSFLSLVGSPSFPLSHDVAKSRKWKWDGDFCAASRVASDHFFGAIIERVEIASQCRWCGRNWIMELNYLLFVTFGHCQPSSQLKSKPSENHSTKSISFRLCFESHSILCFYFSSTIRPPSRLSSNSIQTGRIFLVLSMTDLFLILVHFSTRSHSSTGFNLIAEIGRRRRKLFPFFYCVWFLFENSIVEKL